MFASGWRHTLTALLFLAFGNGGARVFAAFDELPEEPPADLLSPGLPQEPEKPSDTLFIREFRVIGSKRLPREEVERAVYPFTGPGRTLDDVEGARSALEDAYRSAGYQTVSVNVPQQTGRRGIVVLQVTEAPVGRLRVVGSRFFNPERIRRRAPSLAEGNVPNFNEVQRELIALNRQPDLRITPEFKPGALPGTVDVDLVVQDRFPFHASVELNNRYSANTTPLRLDISARYTNLWQLGHTLGAGFQIAPERPSDAIVYSAYYIAPVPWWDWLSIMIQGIRQNSNVSTLGGTAVAGNGWVAGFRLLFDLPTSAGFFQTASLGMDYKSFQQDIDLGAEVVQSPINYWPVTASYTGVWMGEGYELQLDGALNFSFRGLGSTEVEFDNRRFNSSANFFYFRGSASAQRDLPFGFQLYTLIQGQGCPTPLVDSEQFALGGLNTVRGYLESEVLGDSAVAGSFELRSPSLLGWWKKPFSRNDWRIFVFLDAGAAFLNDPLPEQQDQFTLWSWGVGSTMQIAGALNGAVAVGWPQVSQNPTVAGQPHLTFRVWGEL
ncbi:MAG: BamA/TamA family outer membrane protein [Terrimicrobiaceae bacterium]|nr:BamA/TamA family outer membrane protein [Terrimicrobiaceae bacterium]